MDYPNSHSATSSWSYDNPFPSLPFYHGGNFNQGGGFSNQHRRYESPAPGPGPGHANETAFTGRKRQFSHSAHEYADGGSFVKLYVRGVPREVTEHDIRFLFGKHGNIIEVVLFKEKRNLQQQECCFVKYAKIEDADQAIKALHNQHTFPGGMYPIKVRYAAGEQERLGNLWTHQSKVFVSCLNKQASKVEIAEIFSPYGCVQEVFLLRDEQRQNLGTGFISFSHRDMAAAAIIGLNGKYMMRGCDQPLLVRFADPKKPKTGVSRPVPDICDPVGSTALPNASHKYYQTGSEPPSISSSCAVPTSAGMADPPDCDWSEHVCPDGYTYYYNCATCESRWEKPEEYSFY